MKILLVIAFVGLLFNFSSSQEKLSDREKALKIFREHFSKEREEQRKFEHELVRNYSLLLFQSYPKSDVNRRVEAKDLKVKDNLDVRKIKAYADRKSLIMNGNKIMTIIYNYGAIGAGANFNRRLNVIWNNLPHIYEFSPLVAASVVDTNNRRIHVVSDGLRYYSTVSPDGTEFWTFNPYPYVGINELEPVSKLPGQVRGERRIYFDGLPRECVIRIYTLSGELVKEIYHKSGVDNGREYWNLLNRDGLGVSYGVYIAHIEAPGIGEKLIKFAIIK